MARILDLSNEILTEIFNYLRPYQADPQRASSIALVCLRFSDIIRPIIFQKIDECVGPNYPQSKPRWSAQRYDLLIKSFDANSTLAPMVRDATIEWNNISTCNKQEQGLISKLVSTRKLTLKAAHCQADRLFNEAFHPWFLETGRLPRLETLTLIQRELLAVELIVYLLVPSLRVLNLVRSKLPEEIVWSQNIQGKNCNITTMTVEDVPMHTIEKALQCTVFLKALIIRWKHHDMEEYEDSTVASLSSGSLLKALSSVLNTLQELQVQLDTLFVSQCTDKVRLDLSMATNLRRISLPAYYFFPLDGWKEMSRLGFYRLLPSTVEEIEITFERISSTEDRRTIYWSFFDEVKEQDIDTAESSWMQELFANKSSCTPKLRHLSLVTLHDQPSETSFIDPQFALDSVEAAAEVGIVLCFVNIEEVIFKDSYIETRFEPHMSRSDRIETRFEPDMSRDEARCVEEHSTS